MQRIRDKNIQRIIADTVALCNHHNIEFKLSPTKKVMLAKGIYCNGYFWIDKERNKRQFVVATGKPIKEWLPIFVHESCHLDQWIKSPKLFDGESCLDEWLGGVQYSNNRIKAEIAASKKLELDCEKRTVDKIKKYTLPINIPEYIQKSNLYIHFYNWVYINRKWVSKGKSLYDKKLYSKMNDTFDKRFSSTPQYILDEISNHLL